MRSTPSLKLSPHFPSCAALRVAARKPFDDSVRRELAGFQCQEDARGIQRIEEPESIADEHPAVARDLSSTRYE